MSLDPVADAIRREIAERGPILDPDEKLAIVARARNVAAQLDPGRREAPPIR